MSGRIYSVQSLEQLGKYFIYKICPFPNAKHPPKAQSSTFKSGYLGARSTFRRFPDFAVTIWSVTASTSNQTGTGALSLLEKRPEHEADLLRPI
jgi:hypothetical protein